MVRGNADGTADGSEACGAGSGSTCRCGGAVAACGTETNEETEGWYHLEYRLSTP
jgi:hypothetical protein